MYQVFSHPRNQFLAFVLFGEREKISTLLESQGSEDEITSDWRQHTKKELEGLAGGVEADHIETGNVGLDVLVLIILYVDGRGQGVDNRT